MQCDEGGIQCLLTIASGVVINAWAPLLRGLKDRFHVEWSMAVVGLFDFGGLRIID